MNLIGFMHLLMTTNILGLILKLINLSTDIFKVNLKAEDMKDFLSILKMTEQRRKNKKT